MHNIGKITMMPPCGYMNQPDWLQIIETLRIEL